MNINDILPEFRLRAGAGGGDPKSGLCYMETVAFIAGESVTDFPECVSPAITKFGIALNDKADDDQRQELLPLVWATAGTRSDEHEKARQRILIETACDMAESVLHHYKIKYSADDRPRKAIEAARSGDKDAAAAAASAAYAASAYAYAAAAYAASAASAAADAAAAYAAAAAAAAADAAADAAASAAYAASAADAAEKHNLIAVGIAGLRRAILAGPNGDIPNEVFVARAKALGEAVAA